MEKQESQVREYMMKKMEIACYKILSLNSTYFHSVTVYSTF